MQTDYFRKNSLKKIKNEKKVSVADLTESRSSFPDRKWNLSVPFYEGRKASKQGREPGEKVNPLMDTRLKNRNSASLERHPYSPLGQRVFKTQPGTSDAEFHMLMNK